MPLDTSIAMGYKPVQIPNQLAQYAQMQQIMGGQQEQQLNALKMQEYERARIENEGLSNYLAQADLTNPQTRIGALKYGKRGAEYGKALSEQEKDVAATASSAATTQKTNIDNSRSLLVGVNDQPAYDAWRTYSVSKIPELANILPAQFTPETKDSLLRTAADISKRLTAAPTTVAAGGSVYDPVTKTFTQAPEKTPTPPAPPSMVAEYTFAKTPDGGNFKGSYQDFVTARAAAGRAPAQPRAEQPPVAVVDPVTGKQVLVSREEALGKRMTPAAAMESLPPKEIQKREAALPQATSAVQGFESKSDKFIADLTALKNHPGLSSITGIAAGRMPGLTAEGRAAQALYDKVVAKGGFQALQDLRDASKTGGALGNVSNQEGKQLTASFAAIDRRQNASDVQAAIDQAIADIQGTKTRMREAYDATYAYKSGSEPTAKPAPAAASNIDALLNKYR